MNDFFLYRHAGEAIAVGMMGIVLTPIMAALNVARMKPLAALVWLAFSADSCALVVSSMDNAEAQGRGNSPYIGNCEGYDGK